MLPVLLTLGPMKIYTFGVFFALGFLWASFLLWKNIRLTSFKEEEVFDGLFLSLGGGLFFGRLVYVLLNFNEFGFSILKFILINGYPGISVYGGLFGGIFTLLIYFFFKKIKFLEIIDYFVSPFFIAFVFGKMGAFLSGSEVGEVTNFFLKTKYLGFDGYRHLTAFYESIFFIFAVYFSQKILLEIRKKNYFPGFLFYLSLWYFSFVYFIFDKIKINHLYFFGYSFNKIVSLILLLTISFYLIYYFRKQILEFLKSYEQKIFRKIYQRTKRETGKGKKEKS